MSWQDKQEREPAIAGIVTSIFIHCAIWIGFNPLQADVSIHRQRDVALPSSVVVYIQPALSHAQHVPVVKSTTQTKPFSASKLAPERQRKLADLKSVAGTQSTHMTTREADKPALTDTSEVETSTETPVRLNADELKALVKQELERESARSGRAAGKHEQGVLAADVAQEAIEQARRPKCDNNYKPKVGSVEFSGLMKLPFLLRGALSDKGCKL